MKNIPLTFDTEVAQGRFSLHCSKCDSAEKELYRSARKTLKSSWFCKKCIVNYLESCISSKSSDENKEFQDGINYFNKN